MMKIMSMMRKHTLKPKKPLLNLKNKKNIHPTTTDEYFFDDDDDDDDEDIIRKTNVACERFKRSGTKI